jgi:hypothetical protein
MPNSLENNAQGFLEKEKTSSYLELKLAFSPKANFCI